MATNNSLNINSNTPLPVSSGGTGLSTAGSPARYIVSIYAEEAGFTLIQDAIDAAVGNGAAEGSPAVVWVIDGTYTENLTLAAWVNLCGASDPSAEGVKVIGNATYAYTGNISITNIGFESPNTSPALSFESTGIALAHLQSVNCNGGIGIGLQCTGAQTRINGTIGTLEAGEGGQCFSMTAGSVELISQYFNFTDTESAASGGLLRLIACDVSDSFVLSGTAIMEIISSSVASISADLFPCVSVATGASLLVTNSNLTSNATDTYFVSGVGDFDYACLVTPGTATIIDPGLNTTPLPVSIGQVVLESPLAGINGGTGVDNGSFLLEVNANSTIDQDVSTDAIPIFTSIATAPPVSGSSAVLLDTAYQNTSGHDVLVIVYIAVSSATTADILLGVGNTVTPTQQAIVSGITAAALTMITVPIYLPNNYYALLSTSGTISAAISGQHTQHI